jgi:tetratricopeptide (TPR) repeat protein/tRNA A-37 threonylcarbamoyl transferase component Bud32
VDLSEQLSTALGAAYRIDQELGGGGMSRVFLAEEIALGRRVVVKVLPPEMAAGVNQDRFRREIQLAARLQHPHIVPLLTAGSDGDLLYYVMPFIKGESLRAKLGREGELPVGEAIRILREVTDALAYAHAEGVVHRDIKPDNVMISGGHALVTDFGVAKAVSESTGAHSLTSLGLAIGTPAYMAPEQASGDLHVDHRADIYALGAMAFEMLAGRPPFTGHNAQSLLAAHVTQSPEPVSQLRPAVPLGLNSVVMRCLEKRAADRWQHATELLPQFDLLLTPSTGGTAPTAAAYAAATMSSGGAAALRRSQPARVLVTFALASIGVLGLVWLLVRQLGLPTWVLFAAGGLLAVGLPIMLITARHERQRAIARTTNAYLAAPTGVQRLFTWQKALMGGALAFAGLGVLTIGYTAMRLLGVGTVGTLLAKGALSERDRIVLAEFDNRTGDSTLATTVTELLRTDLSQSRAVSVYDVAQLSEVVRQMQMPRGSRITFDVAKEVATRQGLKAVLAGDISSLGNSYVLSARLVATGTGDVLWAGRENATADQLPAAVDRLSATLRERVGESLRSIRADPPLEQMTTSSTEALRLFAQSQRAGDAGDTEGATALLEKAIGLDSNFAMAHRKLAVLIRNAGGDTAKINRSVRRAYAMRDNLSARERYLVDAAYHNYVAVDTAKTIAAYSALLDQYPDDRAAANNLALIYRVQGKRNEALELYRSSIRSRTAAAVTFNNAIPLEVEIGSLDTAGAMIEAFAVAYPDNPNVPVNRSAYFAATGRLDSARAILERRREATRGNARLQSDVLFNLFQIAMSRGRFDEGTALYRDARRAQVEGFPNSSDELPPAEFVESNVFSLGVDIALALHDTAGAVALQNQLISRWPPERLKSPANMYLGTASAFAALNRAEPARSYWKKWEAAVKDSVRNDPGSFALAVRGRIARAESRFADAVRDFQLAREKARGCPQCYLAEIGRTFDQAGQADSAIVYIERDMAVPSLGPDGSAMEYELLGKLYEKRGDKPNAVKAYQRFTELWKDADPSFQPRVKAARDKIAALGR